MPVSAATGASMDTGFELRSVKRSAVPGAGIAVLVTLISVGSARADTGTDFSAQQQRSAVASVNDSGSMFLRGHAANLAAAGNAEVSVSIPGVDGMQQVNIKTGLAVTGSIAAVQAKLDMAGGNAYALVTNNGGITRATRMTTAKDGHVYLSTDDHVAASGASQALNAVNNRRPEFTADVGGMHPAARRQESLIAAQ